MSLNKLSDQTHLPYQQVFGIQFYGPAIRLSRGCHYLISVEHQSRSYLLAFLIVLQVE